MNSMNNVMRRGTQYAVTLARRTPAQTIARRGMCGNGWYWRHHGRPEHAHNFQHFQRNMRDCFKTINEHLEHSFKSAESTIHTRASLQESTEAYKISVEMPGVVKEGVAIEVEDGILTIEGKKTVEGEAKKYSVKYDISNDKVESSQIKAKLENGILDVTLPKSAEKKAFVVNVE